MPAVPERYQSQVAAQANRRIIEQPTFAPDTSMGDALQKVGAVGLEIADRIQKSQQDKEILKAERETKTRLDKLKYDLEAEVGTPTSALPDRYRQESELIIKEGAAGITSETARNMWTERAKGWQGEGENWTVGLQRKRGVEEIQAWHITTASDLAKQSGDLTISPEVFAKNIGDAKVAIQRDLESRSLSPEVAARQEAMLDTVAEKDRTARWSSGVLAVARSGDFEFAAKMVSSAPGIDEAVKEDALNTIERERNRQDKERAETWRLNANTYELDILDGKGSRSEIDEGVASGRFDPNTHSALVRTLREENDRRKREAEAVTQLSPAQMRAWTDQSASWKGTLLSTRAMPTDLFMGDRSQWAQNHQAIYNAMTPDDQRAIDNEQIKLRDGRGTYEGVNRISGQLTDVAQRVADPSWGIALTPAERKKNPDAAARADKLIGEIWAQASTLSRLNSDRPLTPDQINQAVAVALKQAGETKSEFMDWQLFAREVDPDGRANMNAPTQRAEDMRRYDTAEYKATFAELKAAGRGVDPTPDEVTALMMRRRNKGN